MSRELDPAAVARRLAELRARYVPETVEEGRRRLARERPPRVETLAQRAARGLAELRALCDLADHLHRASPRRP
jgi:hypothetical protein